uniref:Uncharacterized protein n=1 Tax=Anopheles dirus TaxID=7168 RepID=A0A182NX78_9DIPT
QTDGAVCVATRKYFVRACEVKERILHGSVFKESDSDMTTADVNSLSQALQAEKKKNSFLEAQLKKVRACSIKRLR